MKQIALVLLMIGCGSEAERPKAPASASSAASTASAAPPSTATPGAASAASNTPASARLVGQWKVDLDYIKTDAEMLALPPEKREKALEMARTVLKNLRIVFGADGTVKVGTAAKMRAGTFTVTPTGANTMVVDAKMIGANGAEQAESLTVRFVDGKILVTGPDGKATRFERAAP